MDMAPEITRKRNGYLISKALRTFMWASILAALAQQLATTTDAIVVSHLIGPDAISAVNLVMPVLTLCTCLGFLFGMGGAVLAAKAMGRREMVTANRVFTASVISALCIGILLSVVGYFLASEITSIICPVDSRIYPLTLSFLQTIILGSAFSLVGFTLQNFVKTDGNPRLVTMAVMTSTVINFVFDILFIKVFGMDSWRWLTILWALVPAVNIYNFVTCPIVPIVEEGKGMGIRQLSKKPLFWVAIILMVCAGASELSMAQWASAYAEAALGLTKAIGDLMGPCMFAVTMGISRIIFGKYGERLDLKKFMLGSGALCVVCYLLASLSSNPGI